MKTIKSDCKERKSDHVTTLKHLEDVWRRILGDPQAKAALEKLKKDGFAVDHLMPSGSKNPTWANYFTAISFLPDRSSRRRLFQGAKLRKHMGLVKVLRNLVEQTKDPFCETRRATKNEIWYQVTPEYREELERAADVIEELISSNWSMRHRNPRNTVIAILRSTIRRRTGAPHDAELAILIDAALVAGGKKAIFLEPRELDRIQRREIEGRVKAACFLNFLSGRGPKPDSAMLRSSRFSRNPRKRV